MDLGDMIRQTVDLDENARNALATACDIKARALQEIRDKIHAAHGTKSRVSLTDVLDIIDTAAADYERAATPDYWIKNA